MSALLKIFKPRQILQIHRVLSATQVDGARNAGHWYPDYMPGPYPKTAEEKEKAAKKYNLLPEEYEPYPDTEEGCGDYPKLPFHSVDSKDPWYPYDYLDLKKDFNEPLHFAAAHLLSEGISTDDGAVSAKDAFKFVRYLATALCLLYTLNTITYVYPKAEKQIPKAGVVHYTFDLKDVPKKKKKIRDPSCDED